ncbi:hypothetical protein HDU98_000096 [Podochytrium sp. JEL0797]|nr:hypothetical protein HDU98_000096 [Podochytrium sp. JEL0797]
MLRLHAPLRSFSRKSNVGKLVQQKLRARTTPPSLTPLSSPPPNATPPAPIARSLPIPTLARQPLPPAPILASPESSSQGAARIEWFSDPYLLGTRCTQLVNDNQLWYLKDLIRRHKGAANSTVYGVVLNTLARKRHTALALEIWDEMRDAGRVQPTVQTYTTMIQLYAEGMRRREVELKAGFDAVVRIWNDLQELGKTSMIHVNAILQACIPSASVGGFEFAQELYQNLLTNRSESSSTKEKLLIPDTATYTTMMHLYSSTNNDPTRILNPDFIACGLKPDTQLLTTLLTHLSASRSPTDHHAFRSYATAAFTLPFTHDSKHAQLQSNRAASPAIVKLLSDHTTQFEMSPKIVDLLLRFLVKRKDFSRGVQVITTLQERNDLLVDPGVARTIVATYCGAHQFTQALHFLQHDKCIHRLSSQRDSLSPITFRQELATILCAKSTTSPSPFPTLETITPILTTLSNPTLFKSTPVSDLPALSTTLVNTLHVLHTAHDTTPSHKILAARLASAHSPTFLTPLSKWSENKRGGRLDAGVWVYESFGSACVRALGDAVDVAGRRKSGGVSWQKDVGLGLGECGVDGVVSEEVEEWVGLKGRWEDVLGRVNTR